MSVPERPDRARCWWTSGGKGEPALLGTGPAHLSDLCRAAAVLPRSRRVLRLDDRGAGRTGDEPGPGAEPVVLPDADHQFPTDQPERTDEPLRKWLAPRRTRSAA